MDIRLDKLLVDRNLAQNRTKAEEIITTYGVLVNGKLFNKIGKKFPSDSEIRLVISDDRWSSIHAQKLIEGLTKWKINVKGTSWLEIGIDACAASEVLISEGAKHTRCIVEEYALVKERFKDNKQITIIQTSIRNLNEQHIPLQVDGMIIDAMTPLEEVLPFITTFLKPNGIAILVIKPQIELDKTKLNKAGTNAESKHFPFFKLQCID
jgi:23S rRNA (cytidine1920-2'-O)/16S rRNA (cytidine1409-2'-O)-methyltransferase